MGEGILDKVKYLIGIEEEYEDDDEYDIPKETKKYERETVARSSVSVPASNRDSKVVSFQQKTQMKLVLHEPDNFEECPKVVDNLKGKRPVIVNLEKVDTDVARRIFDFISGATYALDGTVQKVANNIFVFAPDNVDVSSSTDIKSYESATVKSIFR